jgi:hypothetical protein
MSKHKEIATPSFTEAAKRPEYERAVADLEKLCGKRRRPMKEAKGGFVLCLDAAKAKSFKLEKINADFLKRGCYVFDTEAGRDKNRIGILPTADKYDVILALGTNGVNWDLETQDIISWLRRLEKEQPFILTGISWEHVSGRFTTKIKQPEKLAMRLLEFAPDVGDPICMENELRNSAGFWLWWT